MLGTPLSSVAFSHRRLGQAVVFALAAGLAGVPLISAGGATPPAFQNLDEQGRGGRGGRGQTPRDNLNQPVGTASISGSVVSATTGAPVRRARVNLSGSELGGARSTITDDEGTFTFVAVPAGRFTLTASKPGFVNMSYGAKQPGRPGTPLQLADGQAIDNADISLARGGVVTGFVVDDFGEPAPGTQVRVMRFVMRTGERTLQQAGQDTTDDRGLYRIYGLQPGSYLVSAMPRNVRFGAMREAITSEIVALLQQSEAGGRAGIGGRGQANLQRAAALQEQLAVEEEQTVAYAPVFYPGTTAASQAMSVTLVSGEERAGVDFQLRLVTTSRIEGMVASAAGPLPQGVQLTLAPIDNDMPRIPGVNNSTARPGGDGRFSFSNITPGQYRLLARAAIRDASGTDELTQGRGRRGRGGFGPVQEVLWASMDVNINGQDLTDVFLTLQPGMKVSGRLTFDGSSSPPDDLTQARISLAPRGDGTQAVGGAPNGTVEANGYFTVNGVSPGEYELRATLTGGRGGRGRGRGANGQPDSSTSGWRLSSAIVNGVDTLDFPLVVEPNQDVGGALLTFTDQTQEITGTLQDALGRPTPDFTIIVYPSDRRYWLPQARRIASTRPGTDGRYTLRDLPAGDYRLTAVTDVEPGEWFNPDFLAQMAAVSIPVTLVEGQQTVQDIRLAGGDW